MTPASQPNPNRDPLSGYIAGDANAIEAARPSEPTEAQWHTASAQIQQRLKFAEPARHTPRHRNIARIAALAAAVAIAVAGVAGWFVFQSQTRDVAQAPAPAKPEPNTRTPVTPDPLADFAVLPIASAEEVDLQRIPGAGVLPVGDDPFAGGFALAKTDELELEDTNPAWSQVTISPGDAPMIFATKPR
jgi:hypothetical protein